MIYAVILGGGKGTRMGNLNLPKQFLKLEGKPIIIHTIEKFLVVDKIDKIIIVVPDEWINYLDDLLLTYFKDSIDAIVVSGGNTRNESLERAIDYIESTSGIHGDDIIVTHDSVRPFVSYRIIEENIQSAIIYGATDTVIPAIDTIVVSANGEELTEIPNRSHMYQGQTPQSFNAKLLIESIKNLTNEQKDSLTDAAKIIIMNKKTVRVVLGDIENIKITTPFDLIVASALIGGNVRNAK